MNRSILTIKVSFVAISFKDLKDTDLDTTIFSNLTLDKSKSAITGGIPARENITFPPEIARTLLSHRTPIAVPKPTPAYRAPTALPYLSVVVLFRSNTTPEVQKRAEEKPRTVVARKKCHNLLPIAKIRA